MFKPKKEKVSEKILISISFFFLPRTRTWVIGSLRCVSINNILKKERKHTRESYEFGSDSQGGLVVHSRILIGIILHNKE